MTETQDISTNEWAAAAQTRAAFYSFLNLHFVTLVDAPFVTRLRNGELTAVLEALLEDETNEADILSGASLMMNYLKNHQEMDLARLTEELGVDRTRLYRGVAKGYGPPPPNEMVWSKSGTDYSVLQTLAGVYRQAGLEPSPDIKERWDYISVEMDFLRELALQESLAWEAGEADEAQHLLLLQRDFMSQHLGEWAPEFIEKSFEFVETDFYRGHLLMLRGFINTERQELELAADALNR